MPLILEIKVVPSSGRQECIYETGRFKCYLKSAPEKGKANQELIAYLSKKLTIPASKIYILSGATSRLKRVAIDQEIELQAVLLRLGIEIQLNI